MDDLSVLNDTEVWVAGCSIPGEYKYSITGIDGEFVYEVYYIAGVACDKVFKKVKV
ncbi:MAG: hypothetical protein MJ230_00990 [bacterium]|nr:hypothetical protein [bacterium]